MTAPTDILTTLTSLAVSVFRERATVGPVKPGLELFWMISDPVLQEAEITGLLSPDQHSAISEVIDLVFSEPDLASLAHCDNEIGPMVMHASGGVRASANALVTGLFSAAFLQIFFLRLPAEESTFIQMVLAGFEELRRAARGERVRVHAITGFAGVTLPEGVQVSTPWGLVLTAPTISNHVIFPLYQPATTCILAEPRLMTIKFDRASDPRHEFDKSERTPNHSRVLFPLACTLASQDTMDPAVPLVTWSMLLLPFLSRSSYMLSFLPLAVKLPVDIGGRIAEFEEWARIVDSYHSPAVDIAARRLASAIAPRRDPSDSLIDAVMVWENLVGTSTEVTFRVTAALAKALEPDHAKRRILHKSLAGIYKIRSRVVHGDSVDHQKVRDAAKKAVDIAIRVLRVFYRRGPEWLAMNSSERADYLLLEEP